MGPYLILLSPHPAHSVNRCEAMPLPTVGGSIVSLLRDQAEKTLNSTPV